MTLNIEAIKKADRRNNMSKMDTIRHFQVKPVIYYGVGAINAITEHEFEKVCIVTDEGMVKFGLLKMITDVLEEKGVKKIHVFSDVEPDPSTDIVERGLVSILHDKPDALIALGGGSAIDTAKAIIYYCNNLMHMFVDDKFITKPYFIALPTTAGTGSEVTEYAVITDKASQRKLALVSDLMMPDAAILDPKLIESLPPKATAATGMDVLTHAIESYISLNNNPFSRSYASKATELVFKSLKESYVNGHNLDAKASMQIASCMAGIAFNSAGLGINHSFAHAIGAKWHLPHGLANQVVLPYVIAYNSTDERAAYLYARLLHSIGLAPEIGKTATETLIRMIVQLSTDMDMALCLKDLGIDEAEYLESKDSLVDKAMIDTCTTTNPIKPTREDMLRILDSIYYGK